MTQLKGITQAEDALLAIVSEESDSGRFPVFARAEC